MIFGDTQLTNDLKNCNNLPSKWSYWCNEKAKQQWIRRLDWMKNVVYPWNNRDWDYKQFVKNRYDPEDVLKLKKDGSISNLINNIDILIKQVESILSAPNPDGGSIAGVTDQPSSNNPNKQRFLDLKRQISILSNDPEKNRNQIEALHDALNQIISSKQITSKEYGLGLMQDGTFQKPPYDDNFFNKSITGEASSSYFIQTGFCKGKETNQNECNRKKFRWIGDTCYKPKYIYIDNSPGFKVGRVKSLKGLVPSIINDISQLNPDSLTGIMNGYSVPGVDIQQCIDEHFENISKSNQDKNIQNIYQKENSTNKPNPNLNPNANLNIKPNANPNFYKNTKNNDNDIISRRKLINHNNHNNNNKHNNHNNNNKHNNHGNRYLRPIHFQNKNYQIKKNYYHDIPWFYFTRPHNNTYYLKSNKDSLFSLLTLSAVFILLLICIIIFIYIYSPKI
jgi:hypothetical protein